MPEDTSTAMNPIDNIREDQPIDWQAYRDKLREFVFERVARAGIEDMEKHGSS